MTDNRLPIYVQLPNKPDDVYYAGDCSENANNAAVCLQAKIDPDIVVGIRIKTMRGERQWRIVALP